MRDIDFDPKKFARDEYGNLYKKNKPGQCVMRDNYSDPVKTLVLLNQYQVDLNDPCFLKEVTNANWYNVAIDQDGDEPTWYLMADINDPSNEYFVREDGSASSELGGVVVEVMRVNEVLKRWSEEGGFYHA